MKSIVLVEPGSFLVFGIYKHGHGSDLSARLFTAIQRVPQQPTAKAVALVPIGNGEPSHKCRWNARLPPELLGHVLRNRIEEHGRRTQRVVTDDFGGSGGIDKDVRDRGPPVHFLARLRLKERIEGFDAAIEALAIVSRTEMFDYLF